MILFCFGTEKFDFKRLAATVGPIREQVGEEEIVVQLGNHSSEPMGCFVQRFFSYEELMSLLSRARIVVSHAGSGLILSCRRAGVVPVVLARKREFGEHVDDHQLELAEKMSQLGWVIHAKTEDDLVESVQRHNETVAKVKGSSRQEKSLVHSLSQCLTSIQS